MFCLHLSLQVGRHDATVQNGKVTDKLCEYEIDELDEGEDVQGVSTHASPIDRVSSGNIIPISKLLLHL